MKKKRTGETFRQQQEVNCKAHSDLLRKVLWNGCFYITVPYRNFWETIKLSWMHSNFRTPIALYKTTTAYDRIQVDTKKWKKNYQPIITLSTMQLPSRKCRSCRCQYARTGGDFGKYKSIAIEIGGFFKKVFIRCWNNIPHYWARISGARISTHVQITFHSQLVKLITHQKSLESLLKPVQKTKRARLVRKLHQIDRFDVQFSNISGKKNCNLRFA